MDRGVQIKEAVYWTFFVLGFGMAGAVVLFLANYIGGHGLMTFVVVTYCLVAFAMSFRE